MDSDDRVDAALEGLAGRYGLSAPQVEQLEQLLDALARDERAPTAVRSPQQAIDVHVADSLVALELEPVRSAHTIADLGSGAGFPGLALAIGLAADVRLVESQAKKSAFLEDVIARTELGNASAVCARVEEWREGLGAHDVVVARALAAQPVVLEYAAPMLRIGRCAGGLARGAGLR